MAPAIQRTRPTRNAANKASVKITAAVEREQSAEAPDGLAEDLLGEAMAPLDRRNGDESQWKAWVEIESEPAFFNGLLRGLGVEDVKVVEVFTVDPDDLDMAMLPQPVLGFVFLSKYVPENREKDAAEAPTDLWFANQTMANGCATLALLNILMNKSTVTLGPDLVAFKSTTAALAPPIRGWLLEENPTLRQKHNAYARRLEHLNADLFVSNEYEDCGGQPDGDVNGSSKKKASHSRKRTRKPAASGTARKRRRVADDEACHYKAFLFSAGHVWVLDGLEDRPVCLGPATPETWQHVALAAIRDKTSAAGADGDMRINVLAVCQAPLATLRAELRANVRALAAARAALAPEARPEKREGRLYLEDDDEEEAAVEEEAETGVDGKSYRLDDAALAPFGLSLAQLRADEKLAPTVAVSNGPGPRDGENGENGDEQETKRAAISALELEQARIQSEYRQEAGQVAHEEARCSGRRGDYGPVVHRWVKKLAERGELQALLD